MFGAFPPPLPLLVLKGIAVILKVKYMQWEKLKLIM